MKIHILCTPEETVLQEASSITLLSLFSIFIGPKQKGKHASRRDAKQKCLKQYLNNEPQRVTPPPQKLSNSTKQKKQRSQTTKFQTEQAYSNKKKLQEKQLQASNNTKTQEKIKETFKNFLDVLRPKSSAPRWEAIPPPQSTQFGEATLRFKRKTKQFYLVSWGCMWF